MDGLAARRALRVDLLVDLGGDVMHYEISQRCSWEEIIESRSRLSAGTQRRGHWRSPSGVAGSNCSRSGRSPAAGVYKSVTVVASRTLQQSALHCGARSGAEARRLLCTAALGFGINARSSTTTTRVLKRGPQRSRSRLRWRLPLRSVGDGARRLRLFDVAGNRGRWRTARQRSGGCGRRGLRADRTGRALPSSDATPRASWPGARARSPRHPRPGPRAASRG